jgi:hypothetical protein
MNEEPLFDDIRQNLKREDKRKTPHQIVQILLELGVQRQTVSKMLTEEKICGRATGFNLMNGAVPTISRKLEQHLLVVLKKSLLEAIKISKSYRKWHTLKAIEQLNRGILAGKLYLEGLNESMEIDFQGIGDSEEIEGLEDSGWLRCIEYE